MLPGNFYHVYNRGNNKENIFKHEKNYAFFLNKFKEYLGDKVSVHAYCLMPNHFHFLIKILKWNDEGFESQIIDESGKRILTPIEKAFKDFFISYAKSINSTYGRTGSLFQYKFKRKQIEHEGQYGNTIPYIHFNPPEAGLCLRPEDWRYSSFNAMISKNNTLVKRKEVLQWYGGRGAFLDYHKLYWETRQNRKRLLDLE